MSRERRVGRVARIALAAATLLVALMAMPFGRRHMANAATPRCSDGRPCPNIVVILTDDQRWDELENMPSLRSALISKGVQYTNAFVPTTLCCPSRATILSGQYSNHSGVWTNVPPYGGFKAFKPHEGQTLAVWLHDAGYRTGLVGKYLNGFTAQAARGPGNPTGLLARPGWDSWTSFLGGLEGPSYYDYLLDLDATPTTPGTATSFGGPSDPSPACAAFGTCYSTSVFGAEAVSFIDATPASQPFFLYLAIYGPHAPFTPAPQDASTLPTCGAGQAPPGCYRPMTVASAGGCPPQNGLAPYCSENIGRLGSNEVSWVRSLPPRGAGFNTGNRRYQEQTLLEVDRQVQAVVSAVAARGQLARTLFVFMGDNSLSGGSHRWTAKETAWDEAGHIPLIVRYDPVTKTLAGTADDRVVLNADIAPTALAVAGVPNPAAYAFDGTVLPTFAATFTRTEYPLEHISAGVNVVVPTFCGVRTTPAYLSADGSVSGSWAYVRYQNLPGTGYPPYEEELYDLSADPFEMDNLAGDAAHAGTLATLEADAQALCSPAPPGFSWMG
jgi:arylsulfatase A-like enzyme